MKRQRSQETLEGADPTEVLTAKCLHRDCCEKIDAIEKNVHIGKGAFGQVHSCRYKQNTCDEYALKRMMLDPEDEDVNIVNEVMMMSKLLRNGIRVPKLYDAWICNGFGYILMQKLSGPTLRELIITRELKINTDRWNKFIRYLSHDIPKMNEVGVFHNDLHDENVLWDNVTKEFYTIDFGLAKDKPFPPYNYPKNWTDFQYLKAKILDTEESMPPALPLSNEIHNLEVKGILQ